MVKKMKKTLSVLLVIAMLLGFMPGLTLPAAAGGDTTIEVAYNEASGENYLYNDYFGQSFTATADGVLSKIYILVAKDPASDGQWTDRALTIFEGDGINGTVLGTKTGLTLSKSQDFTDWTEIDVSSLNISVTNGNKYTFYFRDTTCGVIFSGETGSIYSGGRIYYQGSGYDDYDIYFKVIIVPVAAPTITGISPSSGSTAGNTTVTITGTNLTGATAVKFGGTNAASYTVNSATQITAASPAGTAGTVDITVTTAGGTSAASDGSKFTYIARRR